MTVVSIKTIDKGSQRSAEAEGHPTNCGETVSGQIQGTGTPSVRINTASGETRPFATQATAALVFPSHDHAYNTEKGCHDAQSHTLTPTISASISVNESPVYTVQDAVTTDPGSGGNVNIKQ